MKIKKAFAFEYATTTNQDILNIDKLLRRL